MSISRVRRIIHEAFLVRVGERRGISEAVSAIVLLAVVAAVSFYTMNNSTTKTIDHGLSVSDAMAQKGIRSQELLSIIAKHIMEDKMILELINYGTKEFLVDKVFVDGNESAFIILNSNGVNLENKTLVPRQILSLHVTGYGQTLQILTGSGNVFNFDLGF